jgi:hypothetical protein
MPARGSVLKVDAGRSYCYVRPWSGMSRVGVLMVRSRYCRWATFESQGFVEIARKSFYPHWWIVVEDGRRRDGMNRLQRCPHAGDWSVASEHMTGRHTVAFAGHREWKWRLRLGSSDLGRWQRGISIPVFEMGGWEAIRPVSTA